MNNYIIGGLVDSDRLSGIFYTLKQGGRRKTCGKIKSKREDGCHHAAPGGGRPGDLRERKVRGIPQGHVEVPSLQRPEQRADRAAESGRDALQRLPGVEEKLRTLCEERREGDRDHRAHQV